MGRQVITAAEVRLAGRQGRLEVPAGALVTDAAADLAKDLDVSLVRHDAGDPRRGSAPGTDDDLAIRVRSIVQALLATGGGGRSSAPTPRPVKLARQVDARPQPFDHPGDPGQDVRTVDVVSAADGSPMAAGYMTITEGTFPWTLDYDEVQIVLEGELHIGTAGGTRIGRAGDIIYVPKGNSITFGTPSWAKFVYVTFPADWENKA